MSDPSPEATPGALAGQPIRPDGVHQDLHRPEGPPAPRDGDTEVVIPELRPMFPGAQPFLARFLPRSKAAFVGLRSGFCDLHAFLRYLHDQDWYGFLHASLNDQAAYVMVYEGRTVAAASGATTGEQALGELLSLFEAGAPINAFTLNRDLAQILSGVGSRAWKFNLTENFTGLQAGPKGATFWMSGAVIANMPATLPYEGAFPAPLRPNTLILPKSLAGWAHRSYVLTLRGKDALNAITVAHQGFRSQFGRVGLELLRAMSENLTPAEYALRSDVALHDLEPLIQDFARSGYAREA